MPKRWFPHLRLLASGLRALARIAAALERIADVQEGVTRPREVAPAPKERLTTLEPTSRMADRDLQRAYAIELRLRQTLGYDPSPEQIVKEFDEEEYGPDDLPPATRERLGL